MTLNNTGNAVPSSDPRDTKDNSQVFDSLINNQTPQTETNRLGVELPNWQKVVQSSAAYNFRGDWVTGTAYAVGDVWKSTTYSAGNWFVVPVAYTSGAGESADVSAGNAVPYQDVTSIKPVDTVAALRNFEPLYDGQQVQTLGHTNPGVGSVTFRHDAGDSTSTDNNGTVIVTTGGKRWIAILDGFVTPEMLGGGNGVDNTAPAQAAINFMNLTGGGDVVFSSGDYTFTATTNGSIDGLLRHLNLAVDNVRLIVGDGARLVSTVDARFCAIGGGSDLGNAFQRSGYNITGTYEKGDFEINLATAAEAENFSEGDIALIRTGQTLPTSANEQPFGEYIRVRSANAGTGVVRFERGLRGDYGPENYPAGHPDAGNPAPYLLVNCSSPTKIVTENTGIVGDGIIDTAPASQYPVLFGNQALGFEYSCDIETTGRIFSLGTSDSYWHDYTARTTFSVPGDAAWPISIDKCNTGTRFHRITGYGDDGIAAHLHEGCQAELEDVELHYGNSSASTTGNAISMRARARDMKIEDVRIFGGSSSESEIVQDSTCTGLHIDNVRISNPSGPSRISCAGDDVSFGKNIDVATVLLESDKVGKTQFYRDGVSMPPLDWGATGGSPTESLVFGNRYYAWILPQGANSKISAMATGLKSDELQYVLRFKWAQSVGSASGNVRFIVDIRSLEVGDDPNIPATQSSAINVTAPANDNVQESEITFQATLDHDMIAITLTRDISGGDTLAEDIVFLEAEMIPYG